MITYTSVSERGNREINEDCCGGIVKQDSGCFVVADGLGGHEKGEVASRLVVESVLEKFGRDGLYADFIGDAFLESQEKLLSLQRQMSMQNEMKTTAVICCISRDSIRWGHIGDARLYVFQDRKMLTRTADHSVPQMLVYAGEIRERDIRFHPDRNKLMKVMGTEWEREEYELSDPIDRGSQAVLLCTDGFWELIDERRMLKCLHRAQTVQEWAQLMQQYVERNGRNRKMDNYTAVCIWCE